MTNSDRLYDALEVCLSAISTGVDLEACLKLYPDLAAELRPALLTAQRARRLALENATVTGMNRSRARMLARAEELNNIRRPLFLRVAPRLAMAALALIAVLVLSLNGLAVASAQSLPGDVLYPVKRAAENVSLELASNAENRLKMEESYQQRRAEEIRTLLREKRTSRVSFEGVIDEVSQGEVVVQGIPVVLGAGAQVKGELLPGRLVEVEGTTQSDGRIDAHELHLRFYEYTGELKDVQPGLWTIGDAQFKLLRETHLDPTLRVGEQVLVLVYSSDDGSHYAQAILRVPETLVNDSTSFEPFEIEFTGSLQSIAGDQLTIDDKTVKLTSETETKGDFTIGSMMKVHATVAEDGSLTAREIQAISPEVSSGEDQSREDDSGNTSDPEDHVGENESGDDNSDEDKSSEDDSNDDDQSSNDDEKNGEENSDDKDQSDDNESGEDDSGKGTDDNSSGDDDHSADGDKSSDKDSGSSGDDKSSERNGNY